MPKPSKRYRIWVFIDVDEHFDAAESFANDIEALIMDTYKRIDMVDSVIEEIDVED
jgi:hypothetical protein